jgi:small subunit ribosomal protein S8
MSVTDPIADLLTRVRNAQAARHDVVVVPASKVKIALVDIMKNEGYVRAYKCIRDGKQGLIKIALKYSDDARPAIRGLERMSKPGRRVYKGFEELPYVKNGFGIGILSTSRGIMTAKEARLLKVGGEYLCAVY